MESSTPLPKPKNKQILFYGPKKPNGIFSNFYPCKHLEIDGKKWPTTEHYFQAQKFKDTEKEEMIRNC